jgi:two-component system, cell cycle sensor histidine kinase and response regulator CckA
MAQQQGTSARGSPPVILVVEHDQFYRESIVFALREAGFDVFASEGARRALELSRHLPAIDVLVSAIDLGELADGPELARRIRSLKPNVRIVLYAPSAHSGAAGGLVDAVLLEEPLTISALAAAIEDLLAEPGTASSEASPPAEEEEEEAAGPVRRRGPARSRKRRSQSHELSSKQKTPGRQG